MNTKKIALTDKFEYIKSDLYRYYGKVTLKNSIIVLCFHLVELNNVPWHIIHTLLSGVPLWIRCFVIFAGKIIFVSSCTAIVLKVNGLRKIFSR